MPLPLAAAIPLAIGSQLVPWAINQAQNSPKAQLRRLKAAGIHEQAFFKFGNTGNVQMGPIDIQGAMNAITVGGEYRRMHKPRTFDMSSLDPEEFGQNNPQSSLFDFKHAAEYAQGMAGAIKSISDAGVNPSNIKRNLSQAGAADAAGVASYAAAGLSREQSVTEGVKRDHLRSQTNLNQANRRLANTKRNQISKEIELISERIQTEQAQRQFIAANTDLTKLRASEQKRATAFLAGMEHFEFVKMETEISGLAREIERSTNATLGREEAIRNMQDENGNLSNWDIAKLYMYDMFSNMGGAVAGGAGYLLGRGAGTSTRTQGLAPNSNVTQVPKY